MGKKKEVSVVRTEFKLTDEAIEEFKAIHNEWEFEVCIQYSRSTLQKIWSEEPTHDLNEHSSTKQVYFKITLFWKTLCQKMHTRSKFPAELLSS